MPTSLSLQDLRRGEKLHLRNQQQNDDYGYYHQQQQQQYIHHEQIEFIDDFDDNEFVEEDIIEQELINANDEDVGSSQDVDIEGVINMSIPPTTHDIRNVPIDDHYGIDIGSEQVVVESVDVDEEHAQEELIHHQQIGFHQKEKAQKDCNKIIEIVPRRDDKIEENIREEGTSQQLFHQSFDDVPLFEHSQIGLNEFSTEFLALTRKHRLQPKARAILLDLLRQVMPKENCCPLTVANMRKMVAKDGRMHWFGTALGSSLPSTSKTIARPQHAQMVLSQSSSKMPSTSQNLPSAEYQLDGEYLEEEIIVDDRNVNVIKQQQPRHYSVNDPSLLPRIVETINHLSNEIAYLRSQIESQSNGNIFGTVRKLNKRVTDARFGLHIYNEHNKKVPLSQLTNEEIKNTVKISRMNGHRLIYGMNDITELVLEKVDISAYIHNPSLCGRIVADALFSPEYLADKHILGQGQISSRTRLETLPPEMTELFYDTLRKLGISRIVDEDQEHWLYLARDGVNQRARDLKANRKRKFYIDDQPLFGDEEQY